MHVLRPAVFSLCSNIGKVKRCIQLKKNLHKSYTFWSMTIKNAFYGRRYAQQLHDIVCCLKKKHMCPCPNRSTSSQFVKTREQISQTIFPNQLSYQKIAIYSMQSMCSYSRPCAFLVQLINIVVVHSLGKNRKGKKTLQIILQASCKQDRCAVINLKKNHVCDQIQRHY